MVVMCHPMVPKSIFSVNDKNLVRKKYFKFDRISAMRYAE